MLRERRRATNAGGWNGIRQKLVVARSQLATLAAQGQLHLRRLR